MGFLQNGFAKLLEFGHPIIGFGELIHSGYLRFVLDFECVLSPIYYFTFGVIYESYLGDFGLVTELAPF